MLVYVVSKGIYGEGEIIMSIHSSRESAMAVCKDWGEGLGEFISYEWGYTDIYHLQYYSVSEHKVVDGVSDSIDN